MTILCATDFSTSSRIASEAARALARRLGDHLTLVNVVEPLPTIVAGSAVPVAAGWAPGAIEAAGARLAEIAAELRRDGTAVDTEVMTGAPVEAILDAARTRGARLVVLGTHGRKGAARLFLGSVAEAVARRAPCPVLVVREGATLDGWAGEAPLHLALALDGTGPDRTAIDWTAALAARVPCEVTAVRTYWPPHEAHRYGVEQPWSAGEATPELLRLIERDAGAALRGLGGLRLITAAGDAAERVLAEADRMEVDAVVVGTPAGRPESWVGIDARELLRKATLPVLCVPAAHVAAAARPLPRVRTVLVATDLSERAGAAIPHAYGLLAASGGRVELCHVHSRGTTAIPSGLPIAPPLDDGERAGVEARLRALIPRLPPGPEVVTNVSVVEALDAAEGILQAAERLDADLVVIASHGRTGLARALLGSVAEQVLRRARRPVMVVREGEAER